MPNFKDVFFLVVQTSFDKFREDFQNFIYAITVLKNILFLRRKVVTNLDSILKSRNITLPTKVHLVKAIVFPVVMYGSESCTIKTAEH